jgi:hypothetical protein
LPTTVSLVFLSPREEDRSARTPKVGDWAAGPSGKYRYTLEFLNMVLSSTAMGPDLLEKVGFDATVRAGFFDEVLPTHPRRPIALLNIDGDLDQPYRDCLENLYPLVSPGAVIAFDDFLLEENPKESFPGARRAVKEFLGSAHVDLRCPRRGTPYYIKPV